jgi:imidazolonepropionase-like amidohydrolase
MDVEMSFERRFVAAGGLLTAGADSGVGTLPGFADERTLELLAKAGFSPREVVTIATLNGAKAMRRADRIGSIETGKDADLVLLHGDVSADVASFRHVAVVVKRGVAYDPQKLLASVQGMYGRE